MVVKSLFPPVIYSSLLHKLRVMVYVFLSKMYSLPSINKIQPDILLFKRYISTPVGHYNYPNWVKALREGAAKHIHFVTEVKDSMSPLRSHPIKKSKNSLC